MTHGWGAGLSEVVCTRVYTGSSRDALFHPYIIHGTRALLPNHTHMIYCCSHQTHGRTLAVVSCPYEPICRNYRRPKPQMSWFLYTAGCSYLIVEASSAQICEIALSPLLRSSEFTAEGRRQQVGTHVTLLAASASASASPIVSSLSLASPK